MEKEKAKRMTLDDIVKAKMKRDQDKLTVKEIKVPSIGMSLLFRRPTRNEICDFMDNIYGSDQTTEDMIGLFEQLIYTCCEDLHKQELLEELGIENPDDVVQSIMDEADILTVGDEVASLNPLYDTYANEEKNS